MVDLRVEEQEQVGEGPTTDQCDQAATSSGGKEQGVGMSLQSAIWSEVLISSFPSLPLTCHHIQSITLEHLVRLDMIACKRESCGG
jgi:hypothetical protein